MQQDALVLLLETAMSPPQHIVRGGVSVNVVRLLLQPLHHFLFAEHGVGLTRACLAIDEHGPVDPLQGRQSHPFH